MKHKIIPVKNNKDIPKIYRNTPIELLLQYHNLNKPLKNYPRAKLLIGMCMDNRKQLRIPDNFAFILRSGGGNLRYSEFKVSYAVGVGGVRHIVLIAHNNCGMVNLIARKKEFIDGLVKGAGWSREKAKEHFMNLAPMYEIDDEIEFVCSETKRLGKQYPKLKVTPLYYNIEDNKLYCIQP